MNERTIGIIHNEPIPPGHAFSEASIDVLTQVEAVENALMELGYSSRRIPFPKDLTCLSWLMGKERPHLAFNLCETVDEDPRFAGHPAALLELLDIPFSGSPSASLMLTTDKLITKLVLRGSGISTPDHLFYDGSGPVDLEGLRFPVILKPRLEDAGIGIDQESVIEDEGKLHPAIEGFHARFGPLLIEEYIAGREFNISLLGYPSPRVLPIAEIDFRQFPKRLFHIVGYRAKWDKASFEYRHTPRTFPDDLDPGLWKELERTAIQCFELFMLRDYARVDMRVDEGGRVYVLEINANPCLSPGAGFAAAAEQDGMNYPEMIRRLLGFILQRSKNNGYQAPGLPGPR